MRCVGKDPRISNEFVITLPDRQMGYLIRNLFVYMYFERKKKKERYREHFSEEVLNKPLVTWRFR